MVLTILNLVLLTISMQFKLTLRKINKEHTIQNPDFKRLEPTSVTRGELE